MRTPCVVSVCLLALGGCAGSPRLPEPAAGVQTAETADSPVDLRGVYPLDAVDACFVGDDREIVRSFRSLGDSRTELTEADARTDETISRVVLARTAAGEVVIHETARPARNLLTRFDPPLLFAPAELAVGASVSQTLAVETFTLDDPPRAKSAGTAEHTLTRLPDRAAPERAGRRFAVLESRLRVRLGPALVESVSRFSLDAEGLRERESLRVVRVLGLAVERESERLRRAGSTAAGDSADTP